MKICAQCGTNIIGGRSDKKYCSTYCRMMANTLAAKARREALPADQRITKREQENKRKQEWYAKTVEARRAYSHQKYHNDVAYKASVFAAQAKYKAKTQEARTAKARKRYADLRNLVFKAYGGRCRCCGESEPRFLCIDHIDGGGRRHRKLLRENGVGGGANFYQWIVKNNFPSDLQVLCHNCNMAKGFYGSCPHTLVAVNLSLKSP